MQGIPGSAHDCELQPGALGLADENVRTRLQPSGAGCWRVTTNGILLTFAQSALLLLVFLLLFQLLLVYEALFLFLSLLILMGFLCRAHLVLLLDTKACPNFLRLFSTNSILMTI